MRTATSIGIAVFSLVSGAGWAAGTASAADFDSFLVPGTRAPVVIAERPFALTGLLPDGSLNPKFGSGGAVRAPFPGVADLRAEAAATQVDGKIVVSGYASKPTAAGTYPRHVAVARFLSSGRPDRGFGDGGAVITRQGGRGSEIAALPGGGLLVAGMTGSQKPMLLRLRPDGSPDRRFGRAGVAVVRLRRGPHSEPLEGAVTDLVPRKGGGIVLSIYGAFGNGRPRSSILVRYGPQGRLDRHFGSGDMVALDLPGIGPGVYSLAAQEGRLIARAATSTPPFYVALIGLLGNGRLDRSYGRGGVALGPPAPNGFDVGFALGPEGSAAIAVPGSNSYPPTFALAQITARDASRGGSGGEITPQIRGMGPYSVVIRPGGDILTLSFDVDPPHEPLVARIRFDGDSLGIWPAPGQ